MINRKLVLVVMCCFIVAVTFIVLLVHNSYAKVDVDKSESDVKRLQQIPEAELTPSEKNQLDSAMAASDAQCRKVLDKANRAFYAEDWANAAIHYRWQDGSMTDLGTLGGDYIYSSGQIVGYSHKSTFENPHSFLWQNGRMTDLCALVGESWCYASGINDNGWIVGSSYDASGNRLRSSGNPFPNPPAS